MAIAYLVIAAAFVWALVAGWDAVPDVITIANGPAAVVVLGEFIWSIRERRRDPDAGLR